MSVVDWDAFDLGQLAEQIRAHEEGPHAERAIWAFEEAVRAARIDERLLRYLLAATTCLIARLDECTPRTVLEVFFRRSVSDEEWRERYLPLFG